MKIYTRTGDSGTTGLLGGQRVDKADPRVETYGTIDEANSAIGLARAHGLPGEVDDVLLRVQHDLFVLAAEVATVPGACEQLLKMRLIGAADVEVLEKAIDAAESGLAPLRAFVLPAGTPAACSLHLARTISRRAERLLVGLAKDSLVRGELIMYLNRLSDLLFVLARKANHAAGVKDCFWQSAGRG